MADPCCVNVSIFISFLATVASFIVSHVTSGWLSKGIIDDLKSTWEGNSLQTFIGSMNNAEICFYICYALLALSAICYVVYLIGQCRGAEVTAGFFLLLCGISHVVGLVLFMLKNPQDDITNYGYSLYVAWGSVGLQFLTAVALLSTKARSVNYPPVYYKS